MHITMNARYPRRMQYLDSGNSTNFTSPYAPVSPPGDGGGHSKTNASSPAVVAVIGVLAGAFLIISYYRIFLKYCNGQNFTIWGTRSDSRNGGPPTIVLLEEHLWPPDASGLEESLISRIPTCKYSPDEGIVDGTECSVCLGEFEVGEELRILPKCNHPFHIPCIDTWLTSSSTCPLCRVNIVLVAAVPHALLPVETEPPAPSRAPTTSSILGERAGVVSDEIEILQEQHVQECLEAGQLSGPSSSPSLPSSHGSLPSAANAGIPDSHQIDMPILQHMRPSMSLETSPTSAREIHVTTAPTPSSPPPLEQSVSQKQQLHRQASASPPKQRSYSRARSSGNQKGKHPLLPLSAPQTKRLARLLAKSSQGVSSRSTGSSSMNQVVVELLAQEIFQSNVSAADPVLESRVHTSAEVSTSSTGSSRPGPKIRHDNASMEVMWSIDELENSLRWSASDGSQDALPGPSGHQQQRRDSSSGDEMEGLTERLADAMQLRSYPGSDHEADVPTRVARSSSPSLKRALRSPPYSGSFGTWPSKRPSFKHSMASLKRCGSVSLRQHSCRRSDKVHASEPVLEMFRVE